MTHSVLVVEDEPNIVDSLSMVASETPDLVLLDVMLPRRDGYQVCRAIRANPEWNRVKVIMLSAKGRELDRRKGIALGADDYQILLERRQKGVRAIDAGLLTREIFITRVRS